MIMELGKRMAINTDRIMLIREDKKTKEITIYYDMPDIKKGTPYMMFGSKYDLKETIERLNPKKSTRELLKEISDI